MFFVRFAFGFFIVVDSSIIPCPLGTNPSFTIACLAERCLRLIAENERWQIDYTIGVSDYSMFLHNNYICIARE